MSGRYDFNMNAQKSLKENAADAVNTIYGAGIMYRAGQAGPGGNNVLADAAAKAFSANDLKVLRATDEQGKGFARIISLRQKYAGLNEHWQSWGNPEAHKMADGILREVKKLKARGWKPSQQPVSLGLVKK